MFWLGRSGCKRNGSKGCAVRLGISVCGSRPARYGNIRGYSYRGRIDWRSHGSWVRCSCLLGLRYVSQGDLRLDLVLTSSSPPLSFPSRQIMRYQTRSGAPRPFAFPSNRVLRSTYRPTTSTYPPYPSPCQTTHLSSSRPLRTFRSRTEPSLKVCRSLTPCPGIDHC